MRRFPGRSGIASRVGPSTRTNPAGSPLGETSQRPFADEEATNTNVVAAIHSRCTSSRTSSTLSLFIGAGTPNTSSCSTVVTGVKGSMMLLWASPASWCSAPRRPELWQQGAHSGSPRDPAPSAAVPIFRVLLDTQTSEPALV